MGFNLIDDPWILARDIKDDVQMLSLKELLLSSENLLELEGETAAQNFAILRLLVAINLAVMYRYDINGQEARLESEDQAWKRWEQVWESGKLQKEAISSYLDSVKESFWLDGEGRRFMQAEIATTGTSYKSSKLTGDLSESNNKLRLFQLRNGEAKELLSLDAAARWLLNLNGFDDTSAKASSAYRSLPQEQRLSPGAGWLGKLGLIYVKGGNLFETIMLNTILLKDGRKLWSSVTPYWEQANQDVSERRKLAKIPDDLAAVLTLPSRRLWLTFNNNHKVDGYYLIGGDFFDRTNAFTEQFTLWKKADPKKKDSNEFVPRRHQASRQFWREFQFFASPTKSGEMKQPGVIEWIRRLKANELLANDMPVEICAPTVTYGDKDFFVTDVSSQSIRIFPVVLAEEDSEWRELIQSEIEKIDQMAFAAGVFAKNISLASGASPDIASDEFNRAQEKLYGQLDQPFLEWVAGIDPDQIEEVEDMEKILKSWHQQAAQIGHDFSRPYWTAVRPEALIGKLIQDKKREIHVSIPEAIDLLNWRIYSIYEKDEIDTDTNDLTS